MPHRLYARTSNRLHRVPCKAVIGLDVRGANDGNRVASMLQDWRGHTAWIRDWQVSAWPSTRPIQLIVTPLIFFFSVFLSRWDFLLIPRPPPRALPLKEMWPRLAAISNTSQTSVLLRPPASYPPLLHNRSNLTGSDCSSAALIAVRPCWEKWRTILTV